MSSYVPFGIAFLFILLYTQPVVVSLPPPGPDLNCRRCTDAVDRSACLGHHCHPDEKCFAQAVQTSNGIKYTEGCVHAPECDHNDVLRGPPQGQHGRLLCSQCCSRSGCNALLCSQVHHDYKPYSCLKCDGTDSMQHCTHESCNELEICTVRVVTGNDYKDRFYSGCVPGHECRQSDLTSHNPHHGTQVCGKCCHGEQCNKGLCQNRQEYSPQWCFECDDVNSLQHCTHHHWCHEDQHKCYKQAVTHHQGIRYTEGCAHPHECNHNDVYSHPGPHDGTVCSKCCSSSGCNANLCGPTTTAAPTTTTIPTTTTTTTTTSTTTTTTTTTAKPLDCELCDGGLCGLIPGNDPVSTCPGNKPYCMNVAKNTVSGLKTFTKRCADAHECQSQWWEQSSNMTECTNFNPITPYFSQFTCSYCCITTRCNKDIVPAAQTQYQGDT